MLAPNDGTRLVYSIQEAADALGVSPSSIYKLMRNGQLRPTRILGRTGFTRTEMERFLSTCQEDKK